MFVLRPIGFMPSTCIQHKLLCTDTVVPGFIIHPSTSELAEMLTIDPQALNNENYSGIYDGTGDYIPQYCDDPDKIPRGAVQANSDKPLSDTTPTDTTPTDTTPTE